MKKIKIGYVDFSSHYDQENAYPTRLLRTKYDVQISDNPDYLFYSTGGQEHHNYNCIRIFYTGENLIPNFNYCDYAFGFSRISFGDRYMRLPLWALSQENIKNAQDKSKIGSIKEAVKRPFCATVIGNSTQTDGIRNKFFEMLSSYKPLASGGRWNNNVGAPVKNKIEFQEKYKFTMCFENTYSEGYCTEKLLDAFASHSLPIYYGDPTAVEDFNPKAFINAHDFNSLDELLNFIKKVDQDDKLYYKMLMEPVFQAKALSKYSDKKILDFLSNIIDQPYEKAKRRHFFKPYQDINAKDMKFRDFKYIIKQEFFNLFKKG